MPARNKATAEVAIVVRDKYQNIGIGTEILSYLAVLANKSGLIGLQVSPCRRTGQFTLI